MRLITRAVTALLSVVVLCTMSIAVPAAARPDVVAAAVDEAFGPLLAEYGIPGMAVAVTVEGHQHHFTYGVASRQSAAPVTTETIFEIGSAVQGFHCDCSHLRAGTRPALTQRAPRHVPSGVGG